jgi:D-sedoheptulose 7-phosphate isomerase
MEAHVDSYIEQLGATVAALPRDQLAAMGEMLYRAYRNENQVFTAGNGGSASTASHMAADLGKNTIGPHMQRFRVVSLTDNAAIVTALANDIGYASIFSEQLMNLIQPGDLLVVISASGNSPNILEAMRYAREQCAEVMAVLGFDGGAAASLADLAIVVPINHYGIVEDVHLIINHILVDYFSARLAQEQACLV